MKVLVTGGAGFIGSHIVDRLIAIGTEVVVVDNLVSGRKENINPQAKWVNIDIRSKECQSIIQQGSFDYVIHEAAQTMVPVSLEKPEYDADVNIQGTINILEACRKSGVKKVVFASTAAVYGNNTDVPLLETAMPKPESFYGLSKLVVEKYLGMYHDVFGLDYVVLRYANVYGERQGDAGEGGVVSIFSRKVAHGEPITIFGDGGQTRDFIYVGDVAEANVRALFTDQNNTVYNISTQGETSINDLFGILAEISNYKIPVTYAETRQGDIYRSILSHDKAIQGLKWEPKTKLTDGLAKTYYSLKQRRKG